MTPRSRLDCWEHHECGRGPGAPAQARCRAACESILDGTNGGRNAGRCCWAVAGTFGVDEPDCIFPGQCSACDFRHRVAREELPDLADVARILPRLGYFDVLALVERPELTESGE